MLDTRDGDDSTTVTYSDCPGGGVIVERVVQVTANTAAVGAGPQRGPGRGRPRSSTSVATHGL